MLYIVLGHRIASAGRGIDRRGAARLPRASFALLPATATVVGLVVLRQIPSGAEVAGIALAVAGVALHRPR